MSALGQTSLSSLHWIPAPTRGLLGSSAGFRRLGRLVQVALAIRNCSLRPEAPRRFKRASLLLLIAVSGCAEMQPGLRRDWIETKALKAADRDLGGYALAADDMMVRGEYELALRGYTRAIAQDGLSEPVLAGLGAANLQLDRVGQAREILDRGTRLTPASAPVWNNYGVALEQSGERRAAGDAFKLANALLPEEDFAIRLNIAELNGRNYDRVPASEFTLVRHKSGLYLLLQRKVQREKIAEDPTGAGDPGGVHKSP
jgi:tetratricopeptide (TPR) repeat protein